MAELVSPRTELVRCARDLGDDQTRVVHEDGLERHRETQVKMHRERHPVNVKAQHDGAPALPVTARGARYRLVHERRAGLADVAERVESGPVLPGGTWALHDRYLVVGPLHEAGVERRPAQRGKKRGHNRGVDQEARAKCLELRHDGRGTRAVRAHGTRRCLDGRGHGTQAAGVALRVKVGPELPGLAGLWGDRQPTGVARLHGEAGKIAQGKREIHGERVVDKYGDTNSGTTRPSGGPGATLTDLGERCGAWGTRRTGALGARKVIATRACSCARKE